MKHISLFSPLVHRNYKWVIKQHRTCRLKAAAKSMQHQGKKLLHGVWGRTPFEGASERTKPFHQYRGTSPIKIFKINYRPIQLFTIAVLGLFGGGVSRRLLKIRTNFYRWAQWIMLATKHWQTLIADGDACLWTCLDLCCCCRLLCMARGFVVEIWVKATKSPWTTSTY